MHRNTFFFILFLAVFAAIVAGVNVTRTLFSREAEQSQTTLQISPSPMPREEKNEWIRGQGCGISFSYPKNIFRSIDMGEDGITLVNINDEKQFLIILCQKTISLDLNTKAKEQKQIATISAQLYTEFLDDSQKKTLVFRHPSSKRYVYISGTIEIFDEIISSIEIK